MWQRTKLRCEACCRRCFGRRNVDLDRPWEIVVEIPCTTQQPPEYHNEGDVYPDSFAFPNMGLQHDGGSSSTASGRTGEAEANDVPSSAASIASAGPRISEVASLLTSAVPLAVASHFMKHAIVFGEQGEVTALRRDLFIESLDRMAEALDNFPGGLGSHITVNAVKLRRAECDSSEEYYDPWIHSELPVHVAAGCKGYIDPSAWMANLWLGWIIEFLARFFLFLAEPWRAVADVDDPKVSIRCFEAAYKETLSKHHGVVQRGIFLAGAKRMPSRDRCLALLGQTKGQVPASATVETGSSGGASAGNTGSAHGGGATDGANGPAAGSDKVDAHSGSPQDDITAHVLTFANLAAAIATYILKVDRSLEECMLKAKAGKKAAGGM